VSPDSTKRHAAFVASLGLPYRLLADTDKSVSEMYGVVKETNRLGVPSKSIKRSTFVIDEEGLFQECMYGVSPKGHAEDVVACIRDHS
jgi:thioredoxin-dependent peroxiredoxin